MNKQDIVNKLHEQNGEMTKAQALLVVDAVIDIIREGIISGEKVVIPKFGTFEAKPMPARTARNPKTGETVNVPACKRPVFKVSSTLKAEANA